jgi:hypothetical protein
MAPLLEIAARLASVADRQALAQYVSVRIYRAHRS